MNGGGYKTKKDDSLSQILPLFSPPARLALTREPKATILHSTADFAGPAATLL